jgi:hypothetical protein
MKRPLSSSRRGKYSDPIVEHVVSLSCPWSPGAHFAPTHGSIFLDRFPKSEEMPLMKTKLHHMQAASWSGQGLRSWLLHGRYSGRARKENKRKDLEQCQCQKKALVGNGQSSLSRLWASLRAFSIKAIAFFSALLNTSMPLGSRVA